MSERAKHAHGSRKNLDAAMTNGKVNEFDVLFLSGEDENPAIGWVNKQGEAIILSPADEIAKLETQVEAELANKANTDDVTALETELANKVDASAVEAMIETVVEEKIVEVNTGYEIVEF